MQLALQANKRSASTANLRQTGRVPGVLYGHKVDNSSVELDQKAFRKVLSAAGRTSLISLKLEDQEHTVLIRDVQFHPVRDTILHVDFYQPRLDQAIRAHVPLHFKGESPAVKDLGGILVRAMDEVELEALPTDLPHDIPVDISGLTTFDHMIRVSDLPVTDKVTLHHEPEDVVATVQPPRTEEELEALEEETTEDVESVEGVEDKSEEGEETTDTQSADQTPEEPKD